MKIRLYPKNLLEEFWKEEKKQFSADNSHTLFCLRCGRNIYPPIANNRLSLYAKVNICPYCTTEEIDQKERMLPDERRQLAPLAEWHAVTSGRLETLLQKKNPVLRPSCSFNEIFEGPRKTVYGLSLERPVSEEIYLRAYYRNREWYSSWFPCQQRSTPPPFMKKINQFQEALFKMPEFKSLDTMKQLYHHSHQIGDPTEFNLYSEIDHYNIWLRLITRIGDYNLYVHYYLK